MAPNSHRISTRLPNPRLPNTILPTFVKNDKISSYYFLFKKKNIDDVYIFYWKQ
jgi:hypothetical protein